MRQAYPWAVATFRTTPASLREAVLRELYRRPTDQTPADPFAQTVRAWRREQPDRWAALIEAMQLTRWDDTPRRRRGRPRRSV